MALKFQQAGFANTFALLGGFDAWVEGGYPVEPVILAGPDPSLAVCATANESLIDSVSHYCLRLLKDRCGTLAYTDSSG